MIEELPIAFACEAFAKPCFVQSADLKELAHFDEKIDAKTATEM